MRPTKRFFVLSAVVLAGLFVAEAFAFVSVRNENEADPASAAQSEPDDADPAAASPTPTTVVQEEEDEEDDGGTVAQASGRSDGGASTKPAGESLLPRTGRKLLDLTGLGVFLVMTGALLSWVPPVDVFSFSLD